MPNGHNILAGGALSVFINGIRFATATSFGWSSDTPVKEAQCIDLMEAFELIRTRVRTTGSLTLIRQTADGGAEGQGLVAPLSTITRDKYFSITLVEPGTDIVVFQAKKCSLVNQSWQVQARGLLTGSLSFQAVNWQNEVELLK